MILVAKTPTQAQDIRKGASYTDGQIVFTVDKVQPWRENATIITTKRGGRKIMLNTATVLRIKN